MNFLKFRPRVRDVRLDDGRLVKVTTSDTRTVQHVEDGDRVHATARATSVVLQLRQPSPQKRGLLLKNMGMPKIRQAFKFHDETGLWAPVPPAPKKLVIK